MRFCLNCGTAVATNSTICANCGATMPSEQGVQPAVDQQKGTMSGTPSLQTGRPGPQRGMPKPPPSRQYSPTMPANPANSGYNISGQSAGPGGPGYNPPGPPGFGQFPPPSGPGGPGPGYGGPQSLHGSNTLFAPAGPGGPGYNPQSLDQISTVHMASSGPDGSGYSPQGIEEISTVHMATSGPATPSPGFPPAWAAPSENADKKKLPLDRKLIIVGSAAILLVFGGLWLVLFATVIHPSQLRVQATATAQALATANAQSGTTTAPGTGTAAPSSQQALYTQSTTGSTTLSSPLTAQDNANWDTYQAQGGGGCSFTGSALHASVDHAAYYVPCFAQNSSYSNLALQAQVKIEKGDEGGLIFRGNSTTSQYYIFRISQSGVYGLYLATSSTDSKTLIENNSKTIKQGLGQTNLLTVIAKGKDIYLYINKQFVDHTSDTTYTSGSVGIFGSSNQSPTDTAFNDVQVWKLN
jgi:hypothetical protein